ncbi:coiled-coil domain-containing protein 150 [Erpetoichthys calabaricus]|uniref:Coiled-coil domain containing 150 n=1 Tax=Erpetoichthys calabaricus TaxID=27687 RepID=A0A8C4RV12_ERPCA|nr:coiled-coil domain-containing protein 150 [Erpetoichthys calabaricus]
MLRSAVPSLQIAATVPEALTVLQQRIRVAEEQADGFLRTLGTQGLCKVENVVSVEPLRPVSPIQIRNASSGESDVLWKNYETLVSRMCRLESIIQTLKLNLFRLETEKELNPTHSAQLAQQLSSLQAEHLEELRAAQREVMRVRQQLNQLAQEKEAAEDEAKRLAAALEIATASKMDAAMAAEDLKLMKSEMSRRLQEAKGELAQQFGQRVLLEQSHEGLLQRLQDMETAISVEREQVQELQQKCQALENDTQSVKQKLLKEQQCADELELKCRDLKMAADAEKSRLTEMAEERKNCQMALHKQKEENGQLLSEISCLRDTAEKVQALNDQLNTQCMELSAAVRSLAVENAKLLAEHQIALKEEQQRVSQRLQEQDLLLDAARASIQAELQGALSDKMELQKALDVLSKEHAHLLQTSEESERKMAQDLKLLESTVKRLQAKLLEATHGWQNANVDLVEAKNTVNKLMENKAEMEAELTKCRLELDSVKSSLEMQEKENGRLQDRMASLEQQQLAKHQVEQALEELTITKNKLAYDKGTLQAKVSQLQEEVQSLADVQADRVHLQKKNAALEAKYKQVATELSSIRIHMQRLEAQQKQAQVSMERKEEDFALAIRSRDEALREVRKLKCQVEAMEENEREKVALLQKQLGESKLDSGKVTSTLENVLASHSKVQQTVEKLQIEMGCKDTELVGLRKDRLQLQQKLQTLQEELTSLQSKLSAEEKRISSQMESMRLALEAMRGDNRQLAESLEQALLANGNMQSRLKRAQEELDGKDVQYQQLIQQRQQESEDSRKEAEVYAERLEVLRKQFGAEREAARKAMQREVAELKKVLYDTTAKSAELSRANKELKEKTSDLEKVINNQKVRLKSQNVQIKSFIEKAEKANTNQDSERLKAIEADLKLMESLKEKYQKKNYEQGQMIQKVLSEMACLQQEMQSLLKDQQDAERERRMQEDLQRQCQSLQEEVRQLMRAKQAAEQKLQEAGLESQQISANLEEAQQWFRTKFDKLQTELAVAHQSKKTTGKTFL